MIYRGGGVAAVHNTDLLLCCFWTLLFYYCMIYQYKVHALVSQISHYGSELASSSTTA